MKFSVDGCAALRHPFQVSKEWKHGRISYLHGKENVKVQGKVFRGAFRKQFRQNLGFCPNEGGVSPNPKFLSKFAKTNFTFHSS